MFHKSDTTLELFITLLLSLTISLTSDISLITDPDIQSPLGHWAVLYEATPIARPSLLMASEPAMPECNGEFKTSKRWASPPAKVCFASPCLNIAVDRNWPVKIDPDEYMGIPIMPTKLSFGTVDEPANRTAG